MSSPKRITYSRPYPEWTDLPIELSSVIANHITSIQDYMSFRGVCTLWRSAATFDNFNREFRRVPWLMHVTREERPRGFIFGPSIPRITNFRDVSVDKTHKLFNFPPTGGRRFLSCSGWILTIFGGDVYLTHPMWRIRIDLPGSNTLYENSHNSRASAFDIKKMVLSSSPTLKTDLVVMVIWGNNGQLGFCRPGDASWTVMATWDESFSDIIYHNDKLYAVDDSRRVVECDIHGPNPTEIRHVFSSPSVEPDGTLVLAGKPKLYLVETAGKFLIISRLYNNVKTLSFKVSEIDLTDGTHNEVHNLGQKALFLGFNTSTCLDLSDRNEVKPNCIYFTDDIGLFRDKDANVFCMFDGSIHILVHGISRIMTCGPAIWVVPSF